MSSVVDKQILQAIRDLGGYHVFFTQLGQYLGYLPGLKLRLFALQQEGYVQIGGIAPKQWVTLQVQIAPQPVQPAPALTIASTPMPPLWTATTTTEWLLRVIPELDELDDRLVEVRDIISKYGSTAPPRELMFRSLQSLIDQNIICGVLICESPWVSQFNCSICGTEAFSSYESLQQHLGQHDKLADVKQFARNEFKHKETSKALGVSVHPDRITITSVVGCDALTDLQVRCGRARLRNASFAHANGAHELNPQPFDSADEINFEVRIKCMNKGPIKCAILLDFGTFQLFVPVTGSALSAKHMKDVTAAQPIAPFKAKFGKPAPASNKTIKAPKLDKHGSEPERPFKLPKFAIPKTLPPIHPEATLEPKNYSSRMQLMLWTEEQRRVQDMMRYSLENVHMKPVRRDRAEYELEVEGLAEKRPSLLVGDQVQLFRAGLSATYNGRIVQVKLESIICQFHRSFNGVSSQTFNVNFIASRTNFRRYHHAVTTSSSHFDRLLFPSEETAERAQFSQHLMDEFVCFNQNLNPEQRKAIRSIVNGMGPSSVPFLLFGPPGTGKSVTLCETILQMMKVNRSVRILAVAPSNSAADRLVELLTDYEQSVLRVFAYSRSEQGSSARVLQHCYRSSQGEFGRPDSIKELIGFRVVVSTCVMASRLLELNMPTPFFDVVCIDEAGCAIEPEALASIAGLWNKNSPHSRIVLAGDPKQLGPVVQSYQAADAGFGLSLMERLFLMPVYQSKDGRFIRKLVRNYRSHQHIIQVPSDLFYESELRAVCPEADQNRLLSWSKLKNGLFPVLFHSVSGTHQREGSSPSWFNIEEAVQVQRYVQSLQDQFGRLLRDEQVRTGNAPIAVISPYNKQVHKIREMINRNGRNNLVQVGSVEEFQGQERLVTIISTVRSSNEFETFDKQHHLGFLRNPKRFNVSITRAQCLLIVVGHAQVLKHDEHWVKLLRHCRDHHSCDGEEWDEDDELNDQQDH